MSMRLQPLHVSTIIAALVLASVGAIASPQQAATQSPSASIDPTKALTKDFPNTVSLKQNGHLLEFCPDGTCDGFVASGGVTVSSLRDFAVLYEYFFSD